MATVFCWTARYFRQRCGEAVGVEWSGDVVQTPNESDKVDVCAVWCHLLTMDSRWWEKTGPWAQSWWKEADRWAPHQETFEIKMNIIFSLGLQLNSKQIRKNLGNILEVGNQIWNNFHYCNFFQIFTDFELIQ
jgi:hypothetical protein